MKHEIELVINGRLVTEHVEARLSLCDFVRDACGLTGTHAGCEHGVCGACTIEMDGRPIRSCITLAASCEGRTIRTIEGFGDDPTMAVLRRAFHEEHGLQCGFCTPGMLISARDVLLRKPGLSEEALRAELSGNLCRCTGYAGIVRACLRADVELTGSAAGVRPPEGARPEG